jgi:hypothetical protein
MRSVWIVAVRLLFEIWVSLNETSSAILNEYVSTYDDEQLEVLADNINTAFYLLT